jgi:hypothetical protein
VFLQGFLQKRGAKVWFFDGEIVVECVVNVVKKNYIEIARKRYATFFRFIFVAIPLSGWVRRRRSVRAFANTPTFAEARRMGHPLWAAWLCSHLNIGIWGIQMYLRF